MYYYWADNFSNLACTGIPVIVCMRCVHTHVMTVYLIQGTLEVPQCSLVCGARKQPTCSWTPIEQLW